MHSSIQYEKFESADDPGFIIHLKNNTKNWAMHMNRRAESFCVNDYKYFSIDL